MSKYDENENRFEKFVVETLHWVIDHPDDFICTYSIPDDYHKSEFNVYRRDVNNHYRYNLMTIYCMELSNDYTTTVAFHIGTETLTISIKNPSIAEYIYKMTTPAESEEAKSEERKRIEIAEFIEKSILDRT